MGNLFRFVRIVAANSAPNEGSAGSGGGAFIFAWLLFILMWGVPISVIELTLGRYTRYTAVESFAVLLGGGKDSPTNVISGRNSISNSGNLFASRDIDYKDNSSKARWLGVC